MLTTNTVQPPTPEKPTTKRWSWKAVLTILGLTLFFAGAMTAVIIVQKQNTGSEPAVPVAPTAPVSEPSAAIDPDPAACTLGFTVLDDKAALSCTEKLAYSQFLTEQQLQAATAPTQPNQLAAILPNTEFVYVITVTASSATTENVIITDELPKGVEFVAHANNSPGITANTTKTVVTANLGKIPAGVKRVQFRAKALATATGSLVNTAKVTVGNNTGAGSPASCPAHTLAVSKPGDIACTSKEAFTNFTTVKTDKGEKIPANGMISAGKEFVYAITVTATSPTQDQAIVTDVLPVGVSYVGKNPLDDRGPKQTYDAATRTLTAEVTGFTAGALTKVVEFKVKTATDMAVGKFTNTAKVALKGSSATASSCDVALEIPPKGTAACEKRAFTNFTSKGGVGVPNSIVQPGNVFVYQVKVLASEPSNGTVKLVDTLPAGIEFMEDPDNTVGLQLSSDKRTVSLDLGSLGTTATNKITTVEFKVKVANTASGTLKNAVAVTTGTTAPYQCEQSLTVQQIGSPPATPAPGCNDVCRVNADCSNSAHICYTGSSTTGRCRLDSNVTSESCSPPVAVGTPATPDAPTQPTLPPELPKTGPEDWSNWLKAGLITLGAGAILLLLL